MQASLKLNTKNSQYVIVTFSNDQKMDILPEKPFKIQQEQLNHLQLVQSRMSQTQLKFPHVNPVFQSNVFNGEANQCKRCECWKRWALTQEQNLLKIEADLIEKQMLLKNIISKMQKQIRQKNAKNEEYKKLLQESQLKKGQLDAKIKNISAQLLKRQSKKTTTLTDKQTQISKRQWKIGTYADKQTQISIRQQKINIIADKQTFITPEKLNQEHLFLHLPKKIQLKQLPNDSKRQVLTSSTIKNYAKTSTIATKTDGWMSTHTKFMETNDKFMPPSNEFQRKGNCNCKCTQSTMTNTDKTLFQNQILRDYNSTLVERLRASKLRKYF